MLITRYTQATAVLEDSGVVPPPVPQDAEPGTLAWLRARVSRFASGPVHAERRRAVVELLASFDPAELRVRARALAGVPADEVAARSFGVDQVAAVSAAASGYLSGETSPEADAAVRELLPLGIPMITVLLQAHASTAALIANARAHDDGVTPIEDLLHETLRHDPPLKRTRRVGVEIDLVAANRDPDVFPDPDRFDPSRGRTPHLTFGHGVRPCPAAAHALAIAAGYLEGNRS
ncbi:hypothetical protein [Nonomuraea endophytica]|uniref:Cytochrome P450 n=1 Tax=Nonomuraea endophytica TaxID=714136 RepID=A0A7W8A4X1_9ACTN|nr:hypothetical protein [Nonomuraea endophytica]MBB5079637.1 cytochrome P450 [Nonomuraea endophytica]